MQCTQFCVFASYIFSWDKVTLPRFPSVAFKPSSGFLFNFNSIPLPIVKFDVCVRARAPVCVRVYVCICVLLGRDSSTDMFFSKSSATNPFSYGSQNILDEFSFSWPSAFSRIIMLTTCHDVCHTLRVQRGSRMSVHDKRGVWEEDTTTLYRCGSAVVKRDHGEMTVRIRTQYSRVCVW